MTSTYVINNSPSAPLDGDIPQRVWTGKDVSYRHLRVFGCLSYVHVAKDKRGKVDPKTRPRIFLGYDDDEFGYWPWNLAEKKVIRCRDILFKEEKTITNWETEKKIGSFDSTDKDQLDETRIHPVRTRMLPKEQNGPDGFRQGTKSNEGGPDAETGQDHESDSDEELSSL